MSHFLLFLLLALGPGSSLAASDESSACAMIGDGLLKIGEDSTVHFDAYHSPITGPYLAEMTKKNGGNPVEGHRADRRDKGPVDRALAPNFEVFTDLHSKKVLWVTRHSPISEEASKAVQGVAGVLSRAIGQEEKYVEPASAWVRPPITYHFKEVNGKCHLDFISGIVGGKDQPIASVSSCRKMTYAVNEALRAAERRRTHLRAAIGEILADDEQRMGSVSFTPSKIGVSDAAYEKWQRDSLANFKEIKSEEIERHQKRKMQILESDEIQSFKQAYRTMCLAFPEIMAEIKSDRDKVRGQPVHQPSKRSKRFK